MKYQTFKPALGLVWVVFGAGCSGLLLLPSEFRDTDDGGAATACRKNSDCDTNQRCVDGSCVDEDKQPTTCRPSLPDGDCPAGRNCQSGVCMPDGETWCDCADNEVCLQGDCFVSFTVPKCSDDKPNGFCPPGGICVVGDCVPIIKVNECTPERTHGLCPSGATCIDGYCIPVADETVEECSPQDPDGICPPGQTCKDPPGQCEDALCSQVFPYGRCLEPGKICVDGQCKEVEEVATCDDFECDPLHRQACDPDVEPLACGDCVEGYHEDSSGGCVADTCESLECTFQARECVESGPYPVCGDCLDNFHEVGNQCVRYECDDLNCEELHRHCDVSSQPVVCGDCLDGYHEDGNTCVANTCADIDCPSLHRLCDESSPPAVCGNCQQDYQENDQGNCVSCLKTEECQDKYYCSDTGDCTQDCVPPDDDDGDCLENYKCSPYGRCVPTVSGDAYCAAAVAEGELVEPTVVLLLDRSGSMKWTFPDQGMSDAPRRWDVMYAALFGEGTKGETNCNTDGSCDDNEHWTQCNDCSPGVVYELQNEVFFGMTLYTSVPGTCPHLMNVAPKIGNYDDMETMYSGTDPYQGTPTGESIAKVVEALDLLSDDSPKYILLATDGEPYTCLHLDSNEEEGRNAAVQAAKNAYNHDIELFVLSVGSDTNDVHLQKVANAGKGIPEPWPPFGDPANAKFYKPTDIAGLNQDLSDILGSVLSCVIKLHVQDAGYVPMTGDLFVDGEKIPRNDPDGWKVLNNTSVVLLGDTCDAVTDGGDHFIWVAFTTCDSGG